MAELERERERERERDRLVFSLVEGKASKTRQAMYI